eukprot:TRINITY_DN281_c0_g1_i2.p2 TRINITY_DN281_c0_g1~~TRINITY_DN281_c0_g1_i2.p2  ORF type:complete len:112 (+),score=5.68 TRINITY_DN281_c0_g1_i2:100-435(+)
MVWNVSICDTQGACPLIASRFTKPAIPHRRVPSQFPLLAHTRVRVRASKGGTWPGARPRHAARRHPSASQQAAQSFTPGCPPHREGGHPGSNFSSRPSWQTRQRPLWCAAG